MDIVRLFLAVGFLAAGMIMFFSATLGANRFKTALNRIHAAALGDTLGLLLCAIGLVCWKGFTFVSFKMLIVVAFFWLASPVGSHMLGRLELDTNNDPGELEIRDLDDRKEGGE